MRETFEIYAKQKYEGIHGALEKDENGEYEYSSVDADWQVWRIAWKSGEVEERRIWVEWVDHSPGRQPF